MTFEKYLGKKGLGSSRIRARWVWEAINKKYPEYQAEEMMYGKKYDVVVFQKAYWTQYAKAFKGLKILDLCDPDWLSWAYNVKEMIELCDVVTCSSVAITEYIEKITKKPVYYIPDRIKTEEVKETKRHRGELKTVAWFGYHTNFPALDYVILALENRKLNLVVISDQEYIVPTGIKNVEVTNIRYNENTVNDDLLRADVVINAKYNKGRFKYKSNNKSLTAWSLGLPVIQTNEDFDKFASETARQEDAEKSIQFIKEYCDIEKSADDLVELIKKYGK